MSGPAVDFHIDWTRFLQPTDRYWDAPIRAAETFWAELEV